MHASSTATNAEAKEKPEFKGFRKRWISAKTGSTGADASESSFVDLFGTGASSSHGVGSDHVGLDFDGEDAVSVKRMREESEKGCVEVLDKTVDDLVEQDLPRISRTAQCHQLDRQALVNTDFNVIRFPWEKGRLGKFFSNEPIVRVPVQKLKPGGRNPVQLELEVSEGGKVTAKASLQQRDVQETVFMGVVRKADDLAVLDDRVKKRQLALQGFWNLLALSICSSSIGLKVTSMYRTRR